jgi:hypothetical protein
MYDDKVSFPVYCPECYKSDNWGADTYARDYDFTKPFFEQFKNLLNIIPKVGIYTHGENINCEFTNIISGVKDVYLAFSIIMNSEFVYYSSNIDNSKQIIDSYNTANSELSYENIGVNKNYSCQYSYWSLNCINCNFVFNCNNCQDCFGCVNLQNKRFCILNEQYSKEQYEEKMKELDMGSHSFVDEFKKEFWKFSLQFPRKYANLINCVYSTGDELRDCKNVKKSFNVIDAENVKYGYRTIKNKDFMDVSHNLRGSLMYEHTHGATDGYNLKFIANGNINLRDSEYSDFSHSSSDLFGCIALKNKQYCILNKQYTKEEYFKMVDKIKKHMDEMPYIDKKGNVYKYGEFFPPELCPFGYNEAVINDHFPLTKEEILEKGYPYKEKIENKYTITLKAKDIPDNIKDVDDSILNEVIECEVSGKAFKITPFELQFYRRMNIPIPHLHPDERYKERMKLRNPMILYTRKCMHEGCTNEFETTYAPDRPEMVYCKECYQREVY